MANALSPVGSPTPPPPEMPQGGAQNALAAPMGPSPMAGAPMGPVGAQGPPGGVPQGGMPPAPNHQQTVAALRHLGASERELMTLLSDPDCGSADMKSKVIDGVTSLVAEGIATPADAVKELSSFPERPFDQKQWLEQKLQTVDKAKVAILQHHQMGYLGAPPDDTPPNTDNHLQTMSGLQANYSGGKAG
jgi:hypothetical protein